MVYPLSAAREQLSELVAVARDTHRAVTISEHGKAVAALISVDDLAELEDRAALAEHLADKAAGRGGVGLDGLDAALDWIDEGREPHCRLPGDGPAEPRAPAPGGQGRVRPGARRDFRARG